MEGRNCFTISPRRSGRIGPLVLNNFDFADDIALLSDSVMGEQALLFRVEVECQKVGFTLNAKETQDMAFNIEGDVRISTTDGSVLDVKED